MPEWLIVAIKESLIVRETSSSTVMGTNRWLFHSLWVQLKKFASLISWPPWLGNLQSWIVKIGAAFIYRFLWCFQKEPCLQNHLFCDDKSSGFQNWLIEAWMSADTARVRISRFSEEPKQVNCLAGRDTHFSSSKTTCNISTTSCWVLKSKGTPLQLESLCFKAHKKLDWSIGLFELLFTVLLRLIAHNIGDKVSDAEGTLLQRVGITLKIWKMELT